MKKLAVVFAILFLCAAVMQVYNCDAQASKQKMIDNAKKALQAGGVDLVGVNIIYDDGNTFWQERAEYLVKDTSQNHGILPHGILREKEYQVIYFDFVESSPVGDAWVFMDPKTGDVISVYEER